MVAPRRTIASLLAGRVVAAALAACATPQNGAAPTGAPATGDPRSADAGATTPPIAGPPYDCNGRPVDSSAFAAARPAATLPAEQLAIVENAVDDAGEALGIDVNEWIVVATSAQHIDLMRRLDEEDLNANLVDEPPLRVARS